MLLFSMSQIDAAKFDAISESFRNRMIFDLSPSPVPMDNPSENIGSEENGESSDDFGLPERIEENEQEEETDSEIGQLEDSLSNLMEEVEGYLDEHDLNNVVSATRTKRGVELVLQDSILFNSGEAEILPQALPFLTKVGDLLSQVTNDIKVEGHTDDVPMSSFQYPSNWELSGARASSVVRFFVEVNNLEEERFSITGFSDTKPLAPNNSASNRDKNRRVEIVILDDNYSDIER
ncbi:OmpA family protein [Ornithinibacillus scapharcae]|uniref:OmpA family protein n=1 Tax=Ornithinibacillus scapharcae TaxID=1147159 RepID=UPI003B4284DF